MGQQPQPGDRQVLGDSYDWHRTDPYDIDEFLTMIDQLAHRFFYGRWHPLGVRHLLGELTPDQLRLLATQEYAYYQGTTWWNAGKLVNSRCLAEQRRLHGALLDELGSDLAQSPGLPPHAELFLGYCEGLGLSRSQVINAPLVPAVMLAVTELRRISSQRPVFETLVASNIIIEKQRPVHYGELLKAYSTHYPWVPKSALLFYEVHAEFDVDHESRGREIVRTYLAHKWQQDQAMSAALRSIGLRLVMYDGIYAVMNGTATVYLATWPGHPGEPWPRPAGTPTVTA